LAAWKRELAAEPFWFTHLAVNWERFGSEFAAKGFFNANAFCLSRAAEARWEICVAKVVTAETS